MVLVSQCPEEGRACEQCHWVFAEETAQQSAEGRLGVKREEGNDVNAD